MQTNFGISANTAVNLVAGDFELAFRTGDDDGGVALKKRPSRLVDRDLDVSIVLVLVHLHDEDAKVR